MVNSPPYPYLKGILNSIISFTLHEQSGHTFILIELKMQQTGIFNFTFTFTSTHDVTVTGAHG